MYTKWAWFCAKETYTRRGVVAVHFLLQSQGDTGEFMYKATILGYPYKVSATKQSSLQPLVP